MDTNLTHWKNFMNPDYLGAYALEPGQELTLTIKSVATENVTGADGKKELCAVMHFAEDVKPMVLNATNSKTITKVLKTPYVENWAGKKIIVYATMVKAFGDMVEALRVRDYLPVADKFVCADCGADIVDFKGIKANVIAKTTLGAYGRMLCPNCKAKAKAEADKLKAEQTDGGVL